MQKNGLSPRLTLGVGLALLGALLLWTTLQQVGPGQRGVVLTFGAVQPGILPPGLHLVVPVAQRVVRMNVRVQKAQAMETAASRDLQDVQTEVAVNYHIEPTDANWVYQHLGRERGVQRRILEPIVSNVVKAVTAHYDAQDLIVQRDAVRSAIENEIRAAATPYKLAIDGVNITNFTFSPQYAAAIERKQVAEQRAQQAQYELQRAQVQAQQRIVTAQAQSAAMALQQKTVTPEVLELNAIKKWDGHLPRVFAGKSLPFLSLNRTLH
ncbi:MAG TPA: prohibitin family protein [Acidiferrobacteraceae bacterium]|nr:prohibitin family protein [Acidiferrobacteraceae bacterium]